MPAAQVSFFSLFFRGMDPIIFCGLCGVASAGVGFAAGTAAFKSLWKIWNKDLATKMLEVYLVNCIINTNAFCLTSLLEVSILFIDWQIVLH